MRWTSALAIFFLLWVMGAIFALPFEARGGTHTGRGNIVPGQADSAPADFQPRRVIKRATVLAVILFVAYYANYTQGWITPEDLDFMHYASSAESKAG